MNCNPFTVLYLHEKCQAYRLTHHELCVLKACSKMLRG